MRRTKGALTAVLTAVLLAVAATPAAAAPQVNGVFDLPGGPKYITEGPDGNVWVVLDGTGALGEDIAKITPAGVVTGYNSATYNNPVGIAAGPDGNLWLTQPNGVVRVDPADPANPTAFPVASITDARGIAAGPDGNLWAASGDKVVKIPPANPVAFTDFTVAGMGARGVSAGASLIWIADFAGQRIVSMTTTGTPTPYPTGGGPQEVGAAPGIGQVAFANPGANPQQIGRITPPGNPLTTDMAPGTDPFGVTRGTDGAWWYANFASNDLGRLTPQGNFTKLAGLPAASGPRQISDGPNRTLWVTLETTKQVARVTGLEPPQPTAPQTVIDKAPEEAVKAGRKGGKAKFAFSSPAAMATFECSLKKKGNRNEREEKLARYGECESPTTYKKLRRGKYTFRVRAVLGATKDASPAEAKFRVKPS